MTFFDFSWKEACWTTEIFMVLCYLGMITKVKLSIDLGATNMLTTW